MSLGRRTNIVVDTAAAKVIGVVPIMSDVPGLATAMAVGELPLPAVVDTLTPSLLPPPPPPRPLLPITSFPISFDRAGDVQRLVYSYPQSEHTLSIPALSFKNGTYVNLTSILQKGVEKPISVTAIYALSNHTLGASYESYLVQDVTQSPLMYTPTLGELSHGLFMLTNAWWSAYAAQGTPSSSLHRLISPLMHSLHTTSSFHYPLPSLPF